MIKFKGGHYGGNTKFKKKSGGENIFLQVNSRDRNNYDRRNFNVMNLGLKNLEWGFTPK